MGHRRSRRRQTVAKGSSSALLLLIIAAAVLAFIPFRVTLAVGSTVSIFAPAYQLRQFSGTHVDIDSLGILLRTPPLKGPTPLSQILSQIGLSSIASYLEATGKIPLLGNGTLLPILPSSAGTVGFPLNLIDYFAVKAQKITVDIAVANGNMGGLLQPFGGGPTLTAGSGTIIQVRLVVISMTISGYRGTSPVNNVYGEDNLNGLNPVFLISFDRVFLDLFLDPPNSASTYIVSADMTVYQGLALIAEAAFLG